MSETNKTQTMREIETKTEREVIQHLKQGNVNASTLTTILTNATSEFEQKMGRPMTYCEMRSMFG